MVIFWLNVWIMKSWLLKYHENRYTNRAAAAVDVQLQRIEHESCRTWELQKCQTNLFLIFLCDLVVQDHRQAGAWRPARCTRTHAHTHTPSCVCFCLSPLWSPLSPVYRRVRSFTSPCFWCAGRAGRAGEEGARPHRQPGQEQPEQRGCGRTERRIGGRRAQKRRVTYQKKPLYSDRLGWCEGDTTNPVLKASIYPTNLHFVFFCFFSSCFLFYFTTSHLPLLHQFISGQSTLCTGRFYCAAPAAQLIYIFTTQTPQGHGRSFPQGLQRDHHSTTLQALLRPFGLPLKTAGLH